jgi:hypothetical protein
VHTVRRAGAPTFLLLLALSAAACTGGSRPPTATVASSSPPGGGPATSNTVVHFKPGQYRYSFNNVTATLSFAGQTATMDVKNGSGAALGAPGIYVITGTDQRLDAKVADAAAVPDGGDATFQVTFPSGATLQTIGLIVLKFGDSNYGAFAPVPGPGAAPASPSA